MTTGYSNVVQVQPTHGLGFQVLKSSSGRDMCHVGVIWLECPTDKRGEAAGFVLKLSHTLQMFDTFGQSFNVAKHHRG